MSKATITDVAKLAEVSIKTVSRVANNETNVSPTTREKVLKAIEQLNYQASPSARNLASNRSFLIALLYDNPSANYIINIQNGVLASCKEYGYDLLIHPCDYQSHNLKNEIISLARKSRIDGLILTPPLSDMPLITNTLSEIGLPFVRIAPTKDIDFLPSVYCNDHQAAFDMAEHLIQLGHKKIGFISGHPDHNASAERREGFEKALEKYKIKRDPNLIAQGYFDHTSGFESALKILKTPQPPTAIFASNDDMAAGAMRAARELNIQVPEKLSIVGFDDSSISSQLWPALTTIRQPVYEMAKSACDLLICNFKKISAHPKDSSHKCQLILRDSTAQVHSSLK